VNLPKNLIVNLGCGDDVTGLKTLPRTNSALFAGLLASPGEESLEIIEQWAEEYPWLQAPAAELKNWSLEWWQAEYTRLFINGYPKTVCPPFESVYCHGVMNAGPCDRLEDFYHSIGYRKP
jgi:TorA maturation chaperone TorD